MPHLTDTNVLLRFLKPDEADYALAHSAVQTLRQRGERLCITLQNVAEFWNVCTRPVEQNGFGLSVTESEERTTLLEQFFGVLPDSENIYHDWRRLVLDHCVVGVQVHDARLVASMRVHNVSRILTFDGRDFARYSSITVVHHRERAAALS
jgi:predicted nucleic acid-binding protein